MCIRDSRPFCLARRRPDHLPYRALALGRRRVGRRCLLSRQSGGGSCVVLAGPTSLRQRARVMRERTRVSPWA
eukprot:4901650-Alexandrium_andersonii.AAC.1